MKKFLKVVLFLMLIVSSIALLYIGNGYNMYKDAINNIPLEEKVEEIQDKKITRSFQNYHKHI